MTPAEQAAREIIEYDQTHAFTADVSIMSAIIQQAIDRSVAETEERVRNKLLNTPEIHNFLDGVPLEAAHQVERWGSEHDAGKSCLDWFWLIGYLAQRIVEYDKAGNKDKALHHCVTTAAALMNWHAALEHRYNGKPYPMVPGHAPSVALESLIPKQEGEK